MSLSLCDNSSSAKCNSCLRLLRQTGAALGEPGWGLLINGALFTVINNKAGTTRSLFSKKHFYIILSTANFTGFFYYP